MLELESQIVSPSSIRNRTEAGEKFTRRFFGRAPQRGSPWPERDAELLALASLPEQPTNDQIAALMELTPGQVSGRLDRLRGHGFTILRGRVTECRWPIGHPGTPKLRFCDSPSVPGKPYCKAHAGKGYITVERAASRREAPP